MPRRLALLALVALTVGCSRYTTRGQGPFTRRPPPVPNGPSALAVAGPKSGGLASPGSSPRTPAGLSAPGSTAAPQPDELALVPPRPPGPAPGGPAVSPPVPPRPPVVAEPGPVVPAGGIVPDSGGLTSPGSPGPAPDQNLVQLKRLAALATEKWKAVDTYEARMLRREVVDRNDSPPTEELIFRFRKEPHSVFMTNVGEVGKDRQVLYVKGQYGDKIHLSTGAGDNRLVGVGFRIDLSPEDPRVTAKSRHSIRDSGFGTGIAKFARLVEHIEAGKLPPDTLRYAGPTQRPEYPYPLEQVTLLVRPGDEKQLPNGATRQLFFDTKPDSPSCGLPVLVITTDPAGKEIEYYCFDRFRLPAGLTDADFSPDRLGKKR